MKKIKILITGSNSPVGYDIASSFNYKKYEITLSYNKRKNLISRFKNFNKIKINLTKKIKKKNQKFYALIHLASATPYRYFSKEKYHQININGLKNILNTYSFKKIIFLSTTSIYNVKNAVSTEQSPKDLTSDYSITKLETEKILVKFAKLKKIKILILRCPAIMCKTKNDINFIERLKYKYIQNQNIKVINPDALFNNLIDTREIIKLTKFFINDVLNFKKINVFNLAASNPTKIYDAMKLILDRTKNLYYLRKINSKKKHHTLISTEKLISIGYKTKSLFDIIRLNT